MKCTCNRLKERIRQGGTEALSDTVMINRSILNLIVPCLGDA